MNTKQYTAKKAKTGPAVIRSSRMGNNVDTKTADNQFIIVGIVKNVGDDISAIYTQLTGNIVIPIAIIQMNKPTTTVILPPSDSSKNPIVTISKEIIAVSFPI